MSVRSRPPMPEDRRRDPSLRPPPHRCLRVYAFDPSLSTRLDTALVNSVTLKVRWEELGPGPVGEYLEVIDVDPASGCCYEPVDLDDPWILAQEGLPPSEGQPRFHQQMVYAVAMRTIQHFEQALGRRVLWSISDPRDGAPGWDFVRQLRIYPHALREANAYYSPAKKALLFGYFPATEERRSEVLPGGITFTCLSHDVVAHETTHALLDGLHRRYVEPSNPDALALHEAFADLVALFQHFSLPEVLRHQIARTRGDLTSRNLLTQLAHQLGQAIGHYGALRDSLGHFEDGEWKPKEPDPTEIDRVFEPHARGSILVAAVFDAFLAIYATRTADLMRIASDGTGVLRQGDLHPDLVDRLAREAAKTAEHMLRMVIRSLDYCPPVDVNFGDYLRALITADCDLVADDPLRYRTAVLEAFRRRGIYPREVRTLSVESLRWREPNRRQRAEFEGLIEHLNLDLLQGIEINRPLDSDREELFRDMEANGKILHQQLRSADPVEAAKLMGLELGPDAPFTIPRDKEDRPKFEVHSVRPTFRVGPEGEKRMDLLIEITQKRAGYFDRERQKQADGDCTCSHEPDFWFRGGNTLIIDLATHRVRYSIGKGIGSAVRLPAQARFLRHPIGSLHFTYLGCGQGERASEPFAILHRSHEEEVA